MLFCDISLIDENFQLQENMYLGTIGNKIAYIGKNPPAQPELYGEVYAKNKGKLLIPGFYNAHSHIYMHILRGYGENLSLMDWLNTRIFPFEAKLTDSIMHDAALCGIAEMLRFGIVSTSDMHLLAPSMGHAFASSGIKANLSTCCTAFGDEAYPETPNYPAALQMLKDNPAYDGDRIRAEFSLHAEYTSTEKVARGLAEMAKEYKTGIHVHVSETASEVNDCRGRHQGKTPVEYLADCGIFDVPTTAAHCVHLTDEDIDILHTKNVTVATCPKSNLKLASGVCPVTKLLAKGVNVAIGTDSVASNNNLNMLEEIKTFALLQKGILQDPTVITPAEALYAATRAGALGQGRTDCGLLKEGYRADIAVVDTNQIYYQPAHNQLNNLIYSGCGTDICLTMVDGQVLYQDGEYPTIDLEQALWKTEQARKEILLSL